MGLVSAILTARELSRGTNQLRCTHYTRATFYVVYYFHALLKCLQTADSFTNFNHPMILLPNCECSNN